MRKPTNFHSHCYSKTSTYTSDGYLLLHAKKDSIFLSRIYIHLCMPAKLFVRIKVVQCVPWCSTILIFLEFQFGKLLFLFSVKSSASYSKNVFFILSIYKRNMHGISSDTQYSICTCHSAFRVTLTGHQMQLHSFVKHQSRFRR